MTLYRETPCEHGHMSMHPAEDTHCPGGSREEVTVDYEAAAIANHDNDPSYAPPYWDDCTDDMKTWYRQHSRSIVDAALGVTEADE